MTSISEAERQQRRLAVENAVGTHLMEGLPPDAQTRRILERYAQGELTEEEFSAAIDRHAQKVLAEVRSRALAGAA